MAQQETGIETPPETVKDEAGFGAPKGRNIVNPDQGSYRKVTRGVSDDSFCYIGFLDPGIDVGSLI